MPNNWQLRPAAAVSFNYSSLFLYIRHLLSECWSSRVCMLAAKPTSTMTVSMPLIAVFCCSCLLLAVRGAEALQPCSSRLIFEPRNPATATTKGR
uniref:Secreted protein n=1 Tax=Macrostomum lignano TaxID=282301 RepID=A0A1I8GCZ7_9PLAT